MDGYLFRLVCLCLASYVLVYFALGALVYFCASRLILVAERWRARSAANLLIGARLLPVVGAVFAVAALCIPSYLDLEPASGAESVGWICLFAATLGAMLLGAAIVRGTSAAVETRRVKVLDGEAPVLALAGLIKPRILISASVRSILRKAELRSAIRHERAHLSSHDNLKRLLILISPWLPLESVECAWARSAEWAADDLAVGGDSGVALALASALVRIARLGNSPDIGPLATSLLGNSADLAARVERLLRDPQPETAFRRAPRFVAPLLAIAAGALLINPAMLRIVHRLLESLID